MAGCKSVAQDIGSKQLGGKRGFVYLVLVLSLAVMPAGVKAQDVFTTTRDYVSQFYPLWFTYYQTSFGTPNRMVGPNKISPIYHYVVAINNDTVYASSFLDLSMEPVIVTIPWTPVNYSVLLLDRYCDIFHSALPANKAGTYALYGPGFDPSKLPDTVTPVPLPFNYMALIFRADRFKLVNDVEEDVTTEADTFRRGMSTMPLCAYLGQSCPPGVPAGGPTKIVPEIEFVLPFKTFADTLIALDPIAFLRQLQTAVDSPKTPPMSEAVQTLSTTFNALFANRTASNRSEFARGARAAHNLIINQYLANTGDTNWITYQNIGHWCPNPADFCTNPDPGSSLAVQRSSITEFIQYANDHEAAAYFHAFKDRDGSPLDGTDPNGYVLTFSSSEIPSTNRFWSLTAYTPNAIELVPNSADKYLVASYTPELQKNADGSVSIYIARRLPRGVPAANWLPIPAGPFNVMLRDYGPTGSVADNTYVPPGIEKVH
ncbi:MAG TPA: DUF1214 domain-containing protein [Bryobacteraceae bacterium]|jgi:hypothetical protein|nr:DUF1214 domain-containing protein [Bryobacteraceae bacterium]